MKQLLVCTLLLAACGAPEADPAPAPTSKTPAVQPAATPLPAAPEPLEVTATTPTKALSAAGSVTLTATATKKNATYAWKQSSPKMPLGEFSAADKAETDWTAPKVTKKTTFVLAVAVDQGEESADTTISLTVTPEDMPVMTLVTVMPSATSAIAGDVITLTAKDTAGSSAFQWTQKSPTSPAGTFANAAQASTSFTLPAVTSATSFTLSLAYKDSDGAAQTAEVIVKAQVPTYQAHIKPLFTQQCAGCHGSAGGFNITSTSALTANASTCGNGPRVKPGDPAGSVLFKRITGTCGPRMPESNPTYFDSHKGDLAKVQAWIAAGAAF